MDEHLKEIRDRIALSKQNYKGPHCCLDMDYNIDKANDENISPCCYNPKFREYYLQAIVGFGGEKIDFCPYCGMQLPLGLSDMWFNILNQEYHIQSPTSIKENEKIPKDFLTDEWWKKRGL